MQLKRRPHPRARARRLHLVSLGCAKNQVDSELMLGRLKQAGWIPTDDPEEAHAIVVNTCSFIESAAEESIETIVELADYKKSGPCRRLVVTGCLPERYREKIVRTLPEVDAFLGTGAFDQIEAALETTDAPCAMSLPDPDLACLDQSHTPRVLTSRHMAYLKVAEGCSKGCTYCIIRKLRGHHRSRPPEDVVAEARELVAGGVRELVLVAQDTTSYGADLDPPASPRQPGPPAGRHPRQRPPEGAALDPRALRAPGEHRRELHPRGRRTTRTSAPTSTSPSSTRATAC